MNMTWRRAPRSGTIRTALCVAMVALGLAGGPAQAATNQWSGPATGGTWDTSATSWSGASGTPWDSSNGLTNVALFATSPGVTATVANVYANGLVFSNKTILTGGTLTMVGANPMIRVAGSGAGSYLPSLAYSGSDANGLILAVNNTQTGLTLTNDSSAGLSSGVLVTVTSSGSSAPAVALNNSNALGSATIAVDNKGALGLSGETGTPAVYLTAAGTYNNNWRFYGGTPILFQSSGITLAGTLTLYSNSVLSSYAAYTNKLNGAIGQSGGSRGLNLVERSASTSISTFQLGAANTFTGGLLIGSNIVVVLTHGGALNNTVGSENTVGFDNATGATPSALRLNGNSVVVASLTNGTFTTAPVVENSNTVAATLTVGNSQGLSGTFGGTLRDGTGSGALSLTKAGSGTLTLSGTNTYTGATTVAGGTLRLTGSANLTNSPLLTLAGGTLDVSGLSATNHLVARQTLQGTGVYQGGLIVDAGATVAPGVGEAVGALTFTNAQVTLSLGATNLFKLLSASAYDTYVVGDGSLLDLGGATLTLSNPSGTVFAADAPFTLITGATSNQFDTGTSVTDDKGNAYTVAYTGTSVVLTAIPEPAVLGLLLCAGLGWALRGFRARRGRG